jgi:hypothetical protein
MTVAAKHEIGLIWPDTDDLEAIKTYIVNQRKVIHQYPGLLEQIQSFESWYQGLGWYDIHIMIEDTTNEAIRRRFAINDILGQRIPDDWVPADGGFQTPPPKPPPPPLIPTSYKFAAVITATAITSLAILKKFRIL